MPSARLVDQRMRWLIAPYVHYIYCEPSRMPVLLPRIVNNFALVISQITDIDVSGEEPAHSDKKQEKMKVTRISGFTDNSTFIPYQFFSFFLNFSIPHQNRKSVYQGIRWEPVQDSSTARFEYNITGTFKFKEISYAKGFVRYKNMNLPHSCGFSAIVTAVISFSLF